MGDTEIIDLAFDMDNKLWGVSRMGDLIVWNGFMWEKKAQAGFRKIRSISFDRHGGLWAINSAHDLGAWDEDAQEWDAKEIPQTVRPYAFDFDNENKLWVVGGNGELARLAGSKWVNFGHVSCWKMMDLSFRSTADEVGEPESN
eukprot:Selendium_serpulae@DN1199_c0_g1_i2.p1